jgi:hypothetical protein
VFEDSAAGVAAAVAAGMRCVAVPCDPRLDRAAYSVAGATVVVSSLCDFNPAEVGLDLPGWCRNTAPAHEGEVGSPHGVAAAVGSPHGVAAAVGGGVGVGVGGGVGAGAGGGGGVGVGVGAGIGVGVGVGVGVGADGIAEAVGAGIAK